MDFDEYERLRTLATARPTRTAIWTAELPEHVRHAIEAADYDHIDPDIDKLMG